MIVIADASAVGTFLIPDESGTFAEFARLVCRSTPIHVPSIWSAEVANLLRTAYRRARINDAEMQDAVAIAETMLSAVQIEPDPSIGSILHHALQTGLSAYDASYALLAARLNAPLLTADGPLRRAAQALGLKVLTP